MTMTMTMTTATEEGNTKALRGEGEGGEVDVLIGPIVACHPVRRRRRSRDMDEIIGSYKLRAGEPLYRLLRYPVDQSTSTPNLPFLIYY